MSDDKLRKLPTEKSRWVPIPPDQKRRPGHSDDAKPIPPKPGSQDWIEKVIDDALKKAGKQ